MKKNYLFISILSLLFIVSCSVDNEELINQNYNDTTLGNKNPIIIIDIGDINDGNVTPETEVEDVTVDLIAGQNIDAGSVTVTDIDGDLDVTYQTEGDWVILETHLYVGPQADMPANNPGNPRIGQFPYATEHIPGTTTFTYSDLLNVPVGECVWVAAHSVLYNTVTGQEETGWADGDDIDGNSWAMWFEVCNIL